MNLNICKFLTKEGFKYVKILEFLIDTDRSVGGLNRGRAVVVTLETGKISLAYLSQLEELSTEELESAEIKYK